jgi:hypothetical protein
MLRLGKLAQQTQLCSLQCMSLRIRNSREVNYAFENERKKYFTDMKQYRKQHREEYWDTQTQGENLWLQKYQDDMYN